MVWEGCSGEPTHGEPYTGTKPETVDTAKETDLQAAAATPYPISPRSDLISKRWSDLNASYDIGRLSAAP